MISRAIILVGTAVVLLSLFLLPWVRFLDPAAVDAQVDQFLRDSHVQDLLNSVPQLREGLGIGSLASASDLRGIFASPDVQHLFNMTRERPYFTGWALWFEVPGTGATFRIGLLVALIVAAVAAVWGLVSLLFRGNPAARIGMAVCGIVALLAFFWTLWYVPTVDTLGQRDNFPVSFACFLAGSRTGIGIWIAALGLLLLATGSALGAIWGEEGAVPSEEEPDDDGAWA